MKNWGKTIIWLIKALMAGILALGLISFFTLCYQYTGIHVENTTGATDYKWEGNQLKSTMTEGFAWFRMDENGFNNTSSTIKSKPDILLMGSSHMEAVQMQPEYTVGYLLNELQPDLFTYNIGMSGHTIYRCIANLDNALQQYQPEKYVIIETDTVNLDVNEMREVIEGVYERIPSYDSGIVYQLQKIPGLKWLYSALDEWVGSESKTIENSYLPITWAKEEESADKLGVSEDYRIVLSEFFRRARRSIEQENVKLIIFYHPKEVLGVAGTVSYETDSDSLKIFQDVCEENEILFVDMTYDFKMSYEKQHVLAHGFSNTAVGAGHLNQYGHQLIAEKLSGIIVEQEGDLNVND